MANKPTGDNKLFSEAMTGVKPLAAGNLNQSAVTHRAKQAKPAQSNKSVRPAQSPATNELEPLAEKWQRPGNTSKTEAKQLAGDHFRTQGELDLHHLKADQARQQLRRFLDQADRDHCSRLRIVHGRGLHSDGRAVLPELVQDELRHDPRVVAFRLAGRFDGGAGAVRVLFKPSR